MNASSKHPVFISFDASRESQSKADSDPVLDTLLCQYGFSPSIVFGNVTIDVKNESASNDLARISISEAMGLLRVHSAILVHRKTDQRVLSSTAASGRECYLASDFFHLQLQ